MLKNKEKKPLCVLGGYIVGATIVRDDWEEKFQARYPLLNEVAELGADLEVTDDLKRADEIVKQIQYKFTQLRLPQTDAS